MHVILIKNITQCMSFIPTEGQKGRFSIADQIRFKEEMSAKRRLSRKSRNGGLKRPSRRPPQFRQVSRGDFLREPGFVDLAVATYPMNTTGSITLLNTVPEGAGTSERIGKRIGLKSLQVRGSALSDTATLTAVGTALIVYDKRPTGALPAITAILNTANSQSFNNDQNSGRFRIIRRMNFAFSGNNATAGQINDNSIHVVDEFIALGMKPQVFKAPTGGSGAIADIDEGALYLVTVGDKGASTADCNLTVGFRLRYQDL